MIMKKFMKIAAVAAAVLAMLVSCEEKEKTPLTVEGKQWIVTFEDFTDGDLPGVIDLGYTEAERSALAYRERVFGKRQVTWIWPCLILLRNLLRLQV